MIHEYIPILVEASGKKEIWKIDVTKLSVAHLIELKKEILSNGLYSKTIQILDGMIKRNIETSIPTHNIDSYNYVRTYKKNKKEEKQLKRVKSRRKRHDKYKR